MKISDIIKQLATEPSTNAKVVILENNKHFDALRDYFKATLDPFINYYVRVKDIPESRADCCLTSDLIQDIIATLGGRKKTGNEARNYLEQILSTLEPAEQTVLKNMINHDPDCKVSDGLVNRVWPNLISSFPCMFAEKYNAKTAKNVPEGKDRIIVQKKEDGGRAIVVVADDGSVTIYSRNGNPLEVYGFFDVPFSKFPGKVFDGELLVIGDTGIADRKTGNGYFNKAVRGTINKEEASKFSLILWDQIDRSKWDTGFDKTPYVDRLNSLVASVATMGFHRIQVVETQIVSTHAECNKFYAEKIGNGDEGAMMKPIDMPWEDTRSDKMLKLKVVADATLKCVAVKPHSKNPELIGSLECVTSDGKLEVSVGAGLSAKDREQKPEYFLNKLIDVQYNALITSKGSDKASMFLPRYSRIREDMVVADTLDKLK